MGLGLRHLIGEVRQETKDVLRRLGLARTRLTRDEHDLVSVLLPQRKVRLIGKCVDVGWKLADRDVLVLENLYMDTTCGWVGGRIGEASACDHLCQFQVDHTLMHTNPKVSCVQNVTNLLFVVHTIDDLVRIHRRENGSNVRVDGIPFIPLLDIQENRSLMQVAQRRLQSDDANAEHL